jgi:hypothetical protein
MTTETDKKNPPIFTCGNCQKCGSRWHLSEYCPYEKEHDLIPLTELGESLQPYPKFDGSDYKMLDDNTIGNCMGVHHVCGGFVDLKEVSKTNNAMICRSCGLRVVLPNTVETYGELREWTEKNIFSKAVLEVL